MDIPPLNVVSVCSLSATAVYAASSVALAWWLGKKHTVNEKWIIAWLIYDAIVHFTLVSVLSFDIMKPGVTGIRIPLSKLPRAFAMVRDFPDFRPAMWS